MADDETVTVTVDAPDSGATEEAAEAVEAAAESVEDAGDAVETVAEVAVEARKADGEEIDRWAAIHQANADLRSQLADLQARVSRNEESVAVAAGVAADAADTANAAAEIAVTEPEPEPVHVEPDTPPQRGSKLHRLMGWS